MSLSAARRWLLGAALLYAASLFLPAVQGSGFPPQTGLDMLRQGASAWRDGVVAWYANPAFWLAVPLGWMGARRSALALSGLGLLLALSSYSAGFMAESAGRTVPQFGFAPGFYVWLGAIACVVIGAGLLRD